MSGAPFVCTPDFYQENSSYLWRFNAVTGTYVHVGSTAETTSLNGIGYDTLNNYIYGVGSSTIYEVGSDGKETAIGAPTNISATGGDFLPGTNFLLTENAGGGFFLEDVTSTSPASAVKPASVILGATAGSVTFTAADVTMARSGSNYVGYGMSTTASSSPTKAQLFKVVIPVSVITANDQSSSWSSLPSETIANAVTVTSVTGISFPSAETPANSDDFGAAYSDSAGDAFFYANSAKVLYEAPAAQLATGAAFTLAYEANGTGLGSGSNDGADCPNASSPFAAPTPENDAYTVVAGNTLTVNSSQGPSLVSNDQILSGATVTMGTTTLEPGGAGQTATTFSAGTTSGTLTGADGVLDVTDAANGYFTFTPNVGFTGPETFTYNLVETSPYGAASATAATVTINVVQQQVVTWSSATALSASSSSTTPNPATDLGATPITYSVLSSSSNTAGCSVDPASGQITYVGAGQCTILATAAATSSYSAASAQLTFNVSALTIPTLSWSPTPTTLTTAQTGTNLTGTPVTNSDGAVSYAIAGTGDTAGCSLASASAPVILSFATAGQCSITASTAATSTYAADSVTVTFTVLALPTFAWAPTPTSFTTGQSPETSLSATTNSDGAVTYAVSSTANSAGCSLASSSSPVELSFSTAGSCTVTASSASTSSYAAATISRLFTITFAATPTTPIVPPHVSPTIAPLAAQVISFTSSPPATATPGARYTPSAAASSRLPVAITVAPGSASVCEISASGVVTFIAAGKCILDAGQPGNATNAAAPRLAQTIIVTKKANHHTTSLRLVLHYANDAAWLTPSAKARLERLAHRIKADGLRRVAVTGYCSSPGSPAHNRILSEARASVAARSLAAFLTARHAHRIHMSGSGKGASDFVVLPSTRARDRRVVITAA
jgi:outer membrane protein OmpA-like peptidoglycan-associated protein